MAGSTIRGAVIFFSTISIGLTSGRQVNRYRTTPPDFSFLVEEKQQTLVTGISENLIELFLPLEFTEAVIKTPFTETLAVIRKWENYPPFLADESLKTEFFRYSSEGTLNIGECMKNLNEIISYLKPAVPYVESGKCIIKLPGMKDEFFKRGYNILNTRFDKFESAWTAATIKTDLTQQNTLLLFAMLLFDISTEWATQTTQIINVVEALQSSKIPQSIFGELSQSECIPSLTKGEDFQVEHCQLTSLGLQCIIKTYEPKEFLPVTILKTVSYENIRLMGENSVQTFVKIEGANQIKLINCNESNWDHTLFPLCPLINIQKDCGSALEKDDVTSVILHCNFTMENPPLAQRFVSGKVFVQNPEALITSGGKSIRDTPPLLILSGDEIIIREDEIEQSFPPMPNTVGLEIIQSKLTQNDIDSLQQKYHWEIFMNYFDWDHYVRYTFLTLQILLLPLTIYTLSIGIKQRRLAKRMLNGKHYRRENYKDNKRLIKTTEI